LLELAVDINETDNYGCSAAWMAGLSSSREQKPHLEDFLFLISSSSMDAYALHVMWNLRAASMHSHSARQLLLHMNPAHYDRSIRDIIFEFGTPEDGSLVHPRAIELLLWRDGQIDEQAIQDSRGEDFSLIHWVAWHFGIAVAGGDDHASWDSFMGRLLRPYDLKNPTTDHHQLQSTEVYGGVYYGFLEPVGVLFAYLAGFWSKLDLDITLEFYYKCSTYLQAVEKLNRAVRRWLMLLQEQAVDVPLEIYGQGEWKQVQQHLGKSLWYSPNRYGRAPRDRLGPKLVGFRFGPEVCDWQLDWDLDLERYAGDFWNVIENSTAEVSYMPGAWVPEQGDGDSDYRYFDAAAYNRLVFEIYNF
jgi:hypothetical protein